jgi:hypothetical protein
MILFIFAGVDDGTDKTATIDGETGRSANSDSPTTMYIVGVGAIAVIFIVFILFFWCKARMARRNDAPSI